MALTRKQSLVLSFIVAFIDKNGYSPSLDEVCESFGYSSAATAHKHVANLERKGYIKRDWNRSRSITVLRSKDEIPVSCRGREPSIQRSRDIYKAWSSASREDLLAEVVRLRLRLERIEVSDSKQNEAGSMQPLGGSYLGSIEKAPEGHSGSSSGPWGERLDAVEHGTP